MNFLSLQSKEKINFLKWSFKYYNLHKTICFFIKEIKSFLKRRIIRNYYPDEIKKLSKLCIDELSVIRLRNNYKSSRIEFGPPKIKICSTQILINDQKLWSKEFKDEEITSSISRWNWLLNSITGEKKIPSFGWGVKLMRSWVNQNGLNRTGLNFDSYTLGERICNSLLFSRLIKGKWNSLPSDLNQFILNDTLQLINNLEYHEYDLTGNHLFNNGRAIYFFSKVFEVKTLEKLSKLIILERLKVLITEDGFLREGSSHYHLLFTRWLFEIYFVTDEYKDDLFKKKLKVILNKMISKSNFFLIRKDNKYKMPLIGDVSPDFDPDWLIGISSIDFINTKASKKNSWVKLAKKFPAFSFTSIIEKKNKIYYSNPKSGWYRLDWGEWTAIWHTFTKNSKTKSTHSHQDFGSVVLYHSGEEILIDKGRYNYNKLKNSAGVLSTLYNNHNTIEVDGIPISILPFKILPIEYQNISYSMEFKKFEKYCCVTLIHNGFDRISKKNINHKRKFYFFKDFFEVKDEIIGNHKIDYSANFNFLKDPDCKNSKFTFKSYKENFRGTKNKLQILSNKDWYYPSYGRKTKSYNKQINFNGKLPFSIIHKISIT